MLFGHHLTICHLTTTTVRIDDARRYHLLLNEGLTYQSPFSSLHQLITMKTTLQQGSYIFIPVLLFSPTYHDEDNVNLEWSLWRDTFHGYIQSQVFSHHITNDFWYTITQRNFLGQGGSLTYHVTLFNHLLEGKTWNLDVSLIHGTLIHETPTESSGSGN